MKTRQGFAIHLVSDCDFSAQRVVDVQSARGVDDHGVTSRAAGLLHPQRGQHLRGLARDVEDRYIVGRAELLELLDRRRTLDVRRHQQRLARPGLSEVHGQLGRGDGLARTLQTGHQQHGRARRSEGDGLALAAHHVHEFVVEHLDQELARLDRRHDLGPRSRLAHALDQVLGHPEVDIGLEQRAANLPQRRLHVGVGQLPGASEA